MSPERLRWWEARFACLDLETTGVDPLEARTVQVALVHVGGNLPTDSLVQLVNPGVEIPAGASEIHGITTEMVRESEFTTTHLAATVAQFFEEAGRKPVVIFNASYDLTVLRQEFKRVGAAWPTRLPFIIDPFVIDAHVSYRKGKRTLGACCEFHKVKLDKAHDAGADAIAAARLAWRLVHSYPTLAGCTLSELQELQAAWARDRAESLQKYFAKIGKADKVNGDWPLRELETERAA